MTDIVLLGAGHAHLHVLRQWQSPGSANARLTCISDFPSAVYSGLLPAVLACQKPAPAMEIVLAALCRIGRRNTGRRSSDRRRHTRAKSSRCPTVAWCASTCCRLVSGPSPGSMAWTCHRTHRSSRSSRCRRCCSACVTPAGKSRPGVRPGPGGHRGRRRRRRGSRALRPTLSRVRPRS